METTRFAPSPTGHIHLGHVYSAKFARDNGQRFLLRIEDIDSNRSRPEFADGILDDLNWLGLAWDGEVRFQSRHLSDYLAALEKLRQLGVLYRCVCSRKQVQEQVTQADGAPHGPDGYIYPGTCRHLKIADTNTPFGWRLDAERAATIVGPLSWFDREHGETPVNPHEFGDIVVARKDLPTSYHLSVVVDDALQGVTLVTRGRDLAHASQPQRVLQALLGLPEPQYHHHDMLVDAKGERLAKRNHAVSVQSLRADGLSPESVIELALSFSRI